MLEHETDSILATLSARTIGDRDAILLREILAADVPRGIKTYIQSETVRLMEAELFASPRFSRVDMHAPGVRRHARAFIASMAGLYSYTRTEFTGLLENAIHFLENYLCRPQWTIQNFVFESGTVMSARDVIAKLDCTVDYAYFRTLIQKVLQRRGNMDITAEEFRTMLVRIDDQIVKQHNPRELALLAKPVFDFLLLRDTPPDVSIPLKPILVFFEDKKMTILRDYIESICRIRRREEITLDELTTLVEDLYLGQGSTAEPVPPPKAGEPAGGHPDIPAAAAQGEESAPPGAVPEAPESHVEAAPAPPGVVQPAPEEESPLYMPTIEIPVPSLFDFVTEEPDGREEIPVPDEPGPRKSVSPPAVEPVKPPERPRAPESYERLFAGSEPAADLTDLRELIQGHYRTRFVKRIFDRDEEKYEDVITSLNNSGSWKDASTILSSLYTAQGLDPFDPDVVEFTDAIHRRYLDAERNSS